MEIGLLHHWFWTPMGLDTTVPTQNTPWDFFVAAVILEDLGKCQKFTYKGQS